MLVRCLMVFLSVMHGGSLMRVRSQVVKFRSSLMRIFWHILLSNPSGTSAASTVSFDGGPRHDCTSLKKLANVGSTAPSSRLGAYADSLVACSTDRSSRR